MAYNVIPVETIRMDDEHLSIHKIRGEDNIDSAINYGIVDGLLMSLKDSRLFVSNPMRFKNIIDSMGRNPGRITLEGKSFETPLTIVRNDPMQFAGTTIEDGENQYQVTEDGRILGRKSIEGAKIDQIGTIPNDYAQAAIIRLCSKKYLNEFLEEYAQGYAKPGMRVVMTLSDEDVVRTKRNGFVTGRITKLS